MTQTRTRYVVCIRDDQMDLQFRKVYEVIPDELGEDVEFVRVVDESGEDYLYPAKFFAEVRLSPEAARALGLLATP